MTRRIAIVIPARFQSSRFPGKPMHSVAGRSLVGRAWDIAAAVQGVTALCVATDDERIAEHVKGFGGRAVLTPAACATGSDRVAATLDALDEPVDGVVNFQGDAVLTPPWVLQALVDVLRNEDDVEMVTPAVRLDRVRYDEFLAAKEKSPSSGTAVTMDHAGNALYFSKRVIPFIRNPEKDFPPVFRHIGLYGYTVDTLRRFTSLPSTALEKAEGLEQLRALHNGIPIRVVEVDYRGRTHWSIDTPEDVTKAEEIITREGELVSGGD